MTVAEILAFNEGVRAVLEIDEAAASATTQQDTRPQSAFATKALRANAEEARDLLISTEPQPVTEADAVNGPTS